MRRLAVAVFVLAGCRAHDRLSFERLPPIPSASDEDCGPALLDEMLVGHGRAVMPGPVRDGLDRDESGTSIDSLEDAGNRLGLPVEQIMLPADLLVQDAGAHVPAIVIGRAQNGHLYFNLWWELSDGTVAVLGCDGSRRREAPDELAETLYVHAQPVPEQGAEDWMRSDEFLGLMRKALARRGVSAVDAETRIRAALQEPGWRGLAMLDAQTRSESPSPPPEAWTFVAADSPGMLIMHGAVLLQAVHSP